MTKQEFIKNKIDTLTKEGKYKRPQILAIALSSAEKEYAQQGGMTNGYSNNQKEIARVLRNVGTNEVKEGSLPPGYYTRLDYKDGTRDYVKAENEDMLHKMPNYINYVNKMRQPIQTPIAYNQQGSQWYDENPPMFMMPPKWNKPPQMENEIVETPVMTDEIRNAQNNRNVLNSINNLSTDSIYNSSGYKMSGDSIGDVSQQTIDRENKKKQYNDTNRINIMNPYGGFGNPAYNLNRGMYELGKGNTGLGVAGLGASLLGNLRMGLSGYSAGKEDRRIGQEYDDKITEDNRRYGYGQQGGKMNIADIIAQNAITDQGGGNTNLEGEEFVKRNNGMVQPVVGGKHIEDGKKAEGVNAKLENGDKVLSDYVKLKPTDIKDLKERYNVSLKRGATFADAQKKLDQQLGIKKLETEKADYLIKTEKASKIADESTKNLSLEVLNKKIGEVSEKINTLAGVRADNFEYLFQKQESQPKKGNGNQLFDKNGKEVTETKDNIAQQGGIFELANKYGISQERAQELIAQQGGQMEQPQDQMQQLYQAVVSMLQEGKQPQEIAQQLIQMGVPEEQVGQVIQEVSQQMQGQQQEAMQEGGKKQYMQSAGEWRDKLNKDKKYGRDAEKEYVDGAFEEPNYKEDSVEDIKKRFTFLADQRGINYSDLDLTKKTDLNKLAGRTQQWDKKNTPNLTNDYNESIGKTQEGLQNLIKNPVFKSIEKENPSLAMKIRNSKAGTFRDFTNDERSYLTEKTKGLNLPSYVEDNPLAFFRGIDKQKIYFDNKEDFEKYKKEKGEAKDGYFKTDKKGVYVKPILLQPKEFGTEQEKQDWINKYGKNVEGQHNQFMAEDPNSDVYYTPFSPNSPQEIKANLTEQPNQEVENRTNVKNIMPNFGSYIPLFSPMQSVSKMTSDVNLIEPIKATPEPMLAEQERQRQTDVNRIEQTGLSPQQQEAVLGQGLAASQMASNDAIGKVEQYNAQNQFATDTYNVQAQTKEDIMNAQNRQDYQNKVFQTVANQERDIDNKYRTNFLQEQLDSKYIDQTNKANMMFDQVALIPGQGLEFLNNKPFETTTNYLPQSVIDKMTPDELNAYKKQIALKGMQGNTYNTSTNSDAVNKIMGNIATTKAKSKK